MGNGESIMENPTKMDDLGYPDFRKPPNGFPSTNHRMIFLELYAFLKRPAHGFLCLLT